MLTKSNDDDQNSSDINPVKDKIISDENQLDVSSRSSSIDKLNSNSPIMKIFSYSKELVLIFAFILTTIATIQNNSGPKITRSPPPVPFFSKGSFVEDYYYGQLYPTQTKVTLSELSFVFYYAAWSAESQNARSAYEHVSQLFYKEAYFSAINCWQPNSECRLQYSKIISWPILMAYTRNGFGVQYQKNLWTESALTKFVTSMLNPISRLTSPEELLDFMSSRDCVVVAFIDHEAHPKQYSSFYRAALKFIEKDPFSEVGFGIVLGQTGTEFGVDQVPAIRAYLWNETLEYNGNITWMSKDITKWIQENIQQVSLYLSPPGIKSSSLAPYMKQGPILLLFTPRNLYLDFSDSYVMLRQIGMEYYNCKDDDWVHEVARDYLLHKRIQNREKLKELQKQCYKQIHMYYQSNEPMISKCNKPMTSSVSYLSVLNASKNLDSKKLSNFCELNEPMSSKCECLSDSCIEPSHNMYTYESNSFALNSKYSTSMLDNKNDEKSPEAINKYNLRRDCQMIRLAEERSEIQFIDDKDTTPLKLISGLGCKSNKTFTLISMDSVSFHTFAERLGVDILELENKTAAMIMDQDNESTYLLDEPVSLSSLSRFIYSFHRDGLQRFLRTNSIQYRHTHFFDINQFLVVKSQETIKIENNEFSNKKKCRVSDVKQEDSHIVIREINSEDFDSVVIKSNKTVVILFYSTNCAFCSMMSHSLLTVSRILYKMPNIEFVRIEGDKNDLAWQYTMAEFPSLLVFPSHSKSDSRKFSSKMPINVTNVLGFVLANLNRSYRLLGLVMACNYKVISIKFQECVKSLILFFHII
ncbi:hypothetical protein ACKWTF_000376 [Chironomus riparius]